MSPIYSSRPTLGGDAPQLPPDPPHVTPVSQIGLKLVYFGLKVLKRKTLESLDYLGKTGDLIWLGSKNSNLRPLDPGRRPTTYPYFRTSSSPLCAFANCRYFFPDMIARIAAIRFAPIQTSIKIASACNPS